MSTPRDGSHPKSACPHVLVVDKSILDRMITSTVLESRNIRVTTFESAIKAMEFLESENEVDMIVSDFCMPGMTGYDLLMELKKSPQLEHIPVIILSSDNIPERVRMCLNGGAKDYILKPIKSVDVPRMLNHI